jgi:hypothetical protein
MCNTRGAAAVAALSQRVENMTLQNWTQSIPLQCPPRTLSSKFIIY